MKDTQRFKPTTLLPTLMLCVLAGGNVTHASEATLDCGINNPVTIQGLPDRDADQASDAIDNCRQDANADQRDSDGDGFGNVCDQDLDNDGVVNFADVALFQARFLTSDADADFNGDGYVNLIDLSYFQDAFLEPPGPQGQCLSDPAYCAGPSDIGIDDALFDGQVAERVAVMRTDDPEVIWHARRIVAGLTTCNRAIDVTILLGSEPYNPGWSWHIDGPVYFHGSNVAAIDGCNQSAVQVEELVQTTLCGLQNSAGGVFCQEWCPWNSRIVSEEAAIPET